MKFTMDEERWREYHVTPRYLAGSSGVGDPGFDPVANWPHHHLDDGPCQLLVTSPDHRIRIGWFGDDYDLWKITVSEDAASAPRWTATFNQNTPPEIVAGLTTALSHDWANGSDRFLAPPSPYWSDSIEPLLAAGWTREPSASLRPEVVAPDGLAGARIHRLAHKPNDIAATLWSGPKGWGTRAEAVFTTATPSHLIAATAAAMADPTPVIRERWAIRQRMEDLVQLTPVDQKVGSKARTPTPLDVRHASVAAAFNRATNSQGNQARARAARSRTPMASPRAHAGQPAPSSVPATDARRTRSR